MLAQCINAVQFADDRQLLGVFNSHGSRPSTTDLLASGPHWGTAITRPRTSPHPKSCIRLRSTPGNGSHRKYPILNDILSSDFETMFISWPGKKLLIATDVNCNYWPIAAYRVSKRIGSTPHEFFRFQASVPYLLTIPATDSRQTSGMQSLGAESPTTRDLWHKPASDHVNKTPAYITASNKISRHSVSIYSMTNSVA